MNLTINNLTIPGYAVHEGQSTSGRVMQILAKPFRRLIATFEVSNASQADDPEMWMLA